MPYEFRPGMYYRMPTHFGPSLGPRQGPDGRTFEGRTNRWTTISVTFRTNPDQLESLLPPGFSLDGEPAVTVAAGYGTDLEWLAGRGYNVLGVSFPARYDGEEDHVRGNFLTVLWENLADPILTGRDDLGISKIWCELPPPRSHQGQTTCIASWLGFTFCELTVERLHPPDREDADAGAGEPAVGTLHYKYIPRTQHWGDSDVAYATYTPPSTVGTVVESLRGEGRVAFRHATWAEMPTQCTIVNAFAALEVLGWCGASLVTTLGAGDVSDQQALR
jgi:hypothetical protein